MKKLAVILLIAALAAFAMGAFAATYNRGFQDEDQDGVCDICGAIDANGDGVCDNSPGCGAGFRRGNGARFIDENNDGICDRRSSGSRPRNGAGARYGRQGGGK